MAGLVLELQQDAMDDSIPVASLLRKAMVVSKKLKITDMQEWIKNELDGYPREKEIPDYREVSGELKVLNPYKGLQPLMIKDETVFNIVSKRKIAQSVSSLDALEQSEGSNPIRVTLNNAIKNYLIENMQVPLEPCLMVPRTSVSSILGSVRDLILSWALELESKGITGDGMSFSTKEKQIAAVNNTHITNNNIGNMSNSQLQQGSAGAAQSLTVKTINTPDLKNFISELKNHIDQLNLDVELKNELQAEISTLEIQVDSPKPKSVIIQESVKSVRNILEGVTGSVIATGLLTMLSSVM